MSLLRIEGAWEDVLARGPELAGRRVRLTVLPEEAEPGSPGPSPNERMLAALAKWDAVSPTESERATLEGFEAFQREHPVTFGELRDEE